MHNHMNRRDVTNDHYLVQKEQRHGYTSSVLFIYLAGLRSLQLIVDAVSQVGRYCSGVLCARVSAGGWQIGHSGAPLPHAVCCVHWSRLVGHILVNILVISRQVGHILLRWCWSQQLDDNRLGLQPIS